MNVYEVTLHGTDSIYLLAPTKYRALELARSGEVFFIDILSHRMSVNTVLRQCRVV